MFLGAACCPRYRANHMAKRLPLQRWEKAAVETFLGAACCHATELTTWQSGSPPGDPCATVPSHFPGANCASNSSNRGSFRNGSHNGDFFSWP